jgi:hypothetical protein
MNATFTRRPTRAERQAAELASATAVELVQAFASEVSDSHEWPNKDNVDNTRTNLLAYIAELEQYAPTRAKL